MGYVVQVNLFLRYFVSEPKKWSHTTSATQKRIIDAKIAITWAEARIEVNVSVLFYYSLYSRSYYHNMLNWHQYIFAPPHFRKALCVVVFNRIKYLENTMEHFSLTIICKPINVCKYQHLFHCRNVYIDIINSIACVA